MEFIPAAAAAPRNCAAWWTPKSDAAAADCCVDGMICDEDPVAGELTFSWDGSTPPTVDTSRMLDVMPSTRCVC